MFRAFSFDRYLLKRQVLALTGIFRIYNPQGQLVIFSQQKIFRLKENIRAFADESKNQEILRIQARQVIDFSAAYDVIDSQSDQKVGYLRRKGWQSMARDEWEIFNASDQPVGVLREDDLTRAMLRRVILGNFLPQNYDLIIQNNKVADFQQRFNLFRYELDLDFSKDPQNQIDRRLGIAAAILLGTIEGRQQ